MKASRLEAFSDAMIAILMTIMILELKVPQGEKWETLLPLFPVFLAYVLSFIYLGIYWNNHHHMFQATDKIDGKVLWANMHLLFWLSLVPFTTGWMGANDFAPVPMAAYGITLLGAGVAYSILQRTIINHGREEDNATLAKAIHNDGKGHLSIFGYAAAIPLAFVSPWISGAIYALVAGMWLIPDRRIEERVRAEEEKKAEQE
ncbi:MAG: TMEM175 family protein [Pyrinomonadaceae bacterium]